MGAEDPPREPDEDAPEPDEAPESGEDEAADRDAESNGGLEAEKATERAEGQGDPAKAGEEATPPKRGTPAWQNGLAAVCILGAAIAGYSYWQYSQTWLRQVKAPRCALAARIYLKEPAIASGTEPHDTTDGRTVYLV